MVPGITSSKALNTRILETSITAQRLQHKDRPPTTVIDRMAGWAQQRAGTSKPEWGGPLGSAPFGDDPADQQMVNAGIQYHNHGCHQ